MLLLLPIVPIKIIVLPREIVSPTIFVHVHGLTLAQVANKFSVLSCLQIAALVKAMLNVVGAAVHKLALSMEIFPACNYSRPDLVDVL